MDSQLKLISDYCWGFQKSRVLQIACRIGVFDAIKHDSLSLEEICRQCNTNPGHTEKLLIGCCAMGLIMKDGKKYRNTDLSARYLLRGEKKFQGDIILHSIEVRDYFDRFENDIFASSSMEISEKTWHEHFIRGMDNVTSSGRGEFFLESIDLKGRKKLLDAGGGPGSYSIAACLKYPELTAVVWDLPETIEIAREYIRKADLQDRISVQAGNWDIDSFGKGYDVVIMSNILHGKGCGCLERLKKAYQALENRGLLAVQEFLLNNAKTGPMIPALFNIMVGAYCESELLAVMGEAGFENASITASNPEMGAWWATASK